MASSLELVEAARVDESSGAIEVSISADKPEVAVGSPVVVCAKLDVTTLDDTSDTIMIEEDPLPDSLALEDSPVPSKTTAPTLKMLLSPSNSCGLKFL